MPPIVAAALQSDLGSITDYTGLAGFAIAFVFPALLSIYSGKRCEALGIEKKTRYSGFLTATFFQYFLAVCGIVLILYVGVSLMYNA